ncbi:MAG: DNA primase [Candidatus Diapherotrites archaeon]|uniref:DNA primase DnaG n=1 Tax=Candidatus Iainarchaeum sp. TaxID=3101447 RepID=A0A8T3YJP5_9ARCH|nr:DNA primase [Candidatus Diapherotrites archaeon]
MAKTYINAVKYMVKIKFEIDGIVDKPDIVGAIFGQSEGLLGDEMDLKELQKNGKLGRIEIILNTSMGRTKGEVLVPSSMDMAETSLLGASIESVDKVGPCEAKLEIVDIEDTRSDKRKEIKDRAKELLKRLMDKSSPETQMLSEEIREDARAADICEYGPDKLPAGPDIESSAEVIVVEGRADVLNLLRNQIRNVIGMNGSNIPQTIIDLSKRKQITAFVDGDRGGSLNARKLAQIARIEYIAKAPDGKEVEELARKEILQSLKRRVKAIEELAAETHFRPREFRPERESGFPRRGFREGPPRLHGHDGRERHGRRGTRPPWRGEGAPHERQGGGRMFEVTPFSQDGPIGQGMPVPQPQEMLSPEEESAYKPMLQELKGTMNARILDQENKVMKEVKVKDLVAEVGKAKSPHAVIFDGVVTKRLVEAAEKAGAKYVIGARKGKVESMKGVKATAL